MKSDKKILRPKNLNTILLLIGSLSFTAVGVLLIKDNDFLSWLGITFFGLCSLVFSIQLIPGSTQLLLTEDGFTITNLFRSHFTYWEDVESFKVGYLGRSESVMFDFAEEHQGNVTGKYIAKQLSDSHSALPSTYGMKATELTELMNEYKQTYAPQQDSS